MKHHRQSPLLVIRKPTLLELMRKHSEVAQAARVRGNKAGIHGGKNPRYSKRERQQERQEERTALSLANRNRALD
jgi:hypothetical protein